MAQKPDPVLKGEAKWKAAKQAVAERNQAAHLVARSERDAREAKAQQHRRAIERDADSRLPKQPPPH